MNEAQQETYYEILRISEEASPSEISTAYQSAKQAFTGANVAGYSVMDEATTKDLLTKIEEAFRVLSDPKRRKKYDKRLRYQSQSTHEGEDNMPITTQPQENTASTPIPVPMAETPVEQNAAAASNEMNGNRLRTIRESRNISLDDLARVTKIPMKFIKALEEENVTALPARVYIQGFIKNLASIYKLNPTETAKAYLQSFDARNK